MLVFCLAGIQCQVEAHAVIEQSNVHACLICDSPERSQVGVGEHVGILQSAACVEASGREIVEGGEVGFGAPAAHAGGGKAQLGEIDEFRKLKSIRHHEAQVGRGIKESRII